MGVHGLWRLIEPSGKPVPVESLENKVLAVDVSIWLHQAIKGFHDAKGAPALNAHLLGIFHRVCKLLYFKIKPIFVFDGGVPVLKRETIAKRNKLKHKNISEADKLQKQLLSTLIKHTAVNKILGDKAKSAIASTSPPKSDKLKETEDLFKLPEVEFDCPETSSDDEEEEESSSQTDSSSPTKHWNLHNIDTKSEHFKSLPADVRHEILSDLKETRKQSSWGRLHELPTKSDDFSGFQVKRLLKRQEVQMALEEAAKEMGGHSLSLSELEGILKDQGVISQNAMGNRIASDETTRYLYIKDIKQALENARRKEERELASKNNLKENKLIEEGQHNVIKTAGKNQNKAEIEFESDLQKAITLSLQDQPSSSGINTKKKLSDYSFLENFSITESDDSSEDEINQTSSKTNLTSAQNYMMEYSGLNPNEIAKIISNNEGTKKRKIDKISKENKENSLDPISTMEIIEPSKKKSEIEESPQKIVKLTTNSDIQSKESDHFSEPIDKMMKMAKPTEIESENVASQEKSKKEAIDSNNMLQALLAIDSASEESDEDFEEVPSSNENENQSKLKNVNLLNNEINTIETMSKSEDSDTDFEEVENKSPKNLGAEDKGNLEIKIETEKFDEEDDFFADVFAPKEENETEKPLEEIINNKLEKSELDNKELIEVPRNLETLMVPDENLEKTTNLFGEKSEMPKLTEEDLRKLKNDLRAEQTELRNEQGLRERLGANITDQMYKEAQDLLELFGLPYVIAPMEAEAQCAYLETVSLTDGTITDDSDIWLFGGKTVYKNFFNQAKHVLEYRAEDIKHHFKLSREQMILLALLVGSDYTIGLQGVGPVTALEVLAAFPSSNTSSFTLSHNQLLMGLNEFRSWFVNNKTVAREKNSLRNKLKNIKFTESFPSIQVVQAYLNPTVDTSEEKFSWSKPDLVGLVDFGRSKFGWSQTKTEEILKPVMKRIKETKYQSTLLNYFQIKHNLNAEEAEKLMSERVKMAVRRIGNDPEEEDPKESDKKIKKSDSAEVKDSTKKKRIRKTASKNKDGFSEENFIEIDQIESLLETIENSVVNEESENKNFKNGKMRKTNIRAKNKVKVENLRKRTANETIVRQVNDCNDEKIPTKKSKKSTNIKGVEEDTPLKCNDNVQEEDNLRNIEKDVGESNIPSSSQLVESVEVKNLKLFKEIIKHQQGKEPKVPVKSNRTKQARKETLPPVSQKHSQKRITGKNLKQSSPKSSEHSDDELKLLAQTETFSEKHLEEIKAEAEKKIEEINKRKIITRRLHKKEIIPQKERDQRNLIRSRLRAIEVYRKSKIDPVSKRTGVQKLRAAKEDADLSEDSSDSDL